MLLEFRASNYKSFKDEFVFSMTPAPKQKGLDYSVQKEKIGRKTHKALSSAVIYGPNASGKTNIIAAMDTMKAIVLRGNIQNAEPSNSLHIASYSLELIPFYHADKKPVSFSIAFIEYGIHFTYSFEIDLGNFLDSDYSRKILSEKLLMNNQIIFKRDKELYVNDSEQLVLNLFNDGVKDNFESALSIAKSGLNDEELFLMNGFKNIFSKNIPALIQKWFSEKFIVIYRSDSVQTVRRFADPKDGTLYVEKTLTEAAKAFGITSNALGYKMSSNEGGDPVLYSIIDSNIGKKSEKDTKSPAIVSEIFESYGTIRFINEFPLIIRALLTGATLVMDEFDASLHPLALINIVNIFHNDEINKNKAQLIFNTHNPIFLNAEIFRRDEIKFVERDDSTHESIHYALSDFKTGGSNSTRKGEDYMKNYFVNKYGAISNVDFSDILDNIINSEGNNNG